MGGGRHELDFQITNYPGKHIDKKWTYLISGILLNQWDRRDAIHGAGGKFGCRQVDSIMEFGGGQA